MPESIRERAALLLWCPNHLGVASSLANFFAERKITVSELLTHSDSGCCFIRVEWNDVSAWENELEFEAEFAEYISPLEAHFVVKFLHHVPAVGVFCSQQTHVLNNLLNNIDASYYPTIEVPFLFSDNDACRKVADRFGIPFFYISPNANQDDVQQKQIEILSRYKPDWLVLPRYDAVLSQSVINAADCPILTVHNSFLPSLKSEKAFEMAYEQGVKFIGATARLVESNKSGPIVEQDFIKFGACPSALNIRDLGHNIERKVFANGLRKLVEHKVIVYNAKTIVFD